MKTFLIHLLNYELWANQRLISALEEIENPPEQAVTIMGHILSAQQIWLGRVIHHPATVSIWEDIPVSWLRETAERQHRKITGYINTLAEPELLQSVDYRNTQNTAYQSTLIDILTHMSHHAAYHRGQVAQLIRPLVDEVPITDFIVWTRDV